MKYPWKEEDFELDTPLAKYFLKGDVLYIKTKKVLIDKENQKENLDLMVEYLNGERPKVFIDAEESLPSMKEQRDQMKREMETHVKQMAVFSNKTFINGLVNIYLAMIKPTIPVRLFNDYKEALEWLDKPSTKN